MTITTKPRPIATDADLQTAREAIALVASGAPADRETFERLFAPGARLFGPGRDLYAATVRSPGDHQAFAPFSDRAVTIHQLARNGDRVVARLTFAGTHCGEFEGCRGGGERKTADAVVVLRFEDGRIADAASVLHWR